MYFPELIRNRGIIIWGAGEMGYNVKQYLDWKIMGGVTSFTDKNYLDKTLYCDKPVISIDTLNKENHYVYIGSTTFRDEIESELMRKGFDRFKDFAWVENIDDVGWNGIQGFDRIIDSRFYGKGTYMGDPSLYFRKTLYNNLPFIKCVGRFSSIAYGVTITINHRLNRIFTGNLINWIPEEIRENCYQYDPLEKQTVIANLNPIDIGSDVWIGTNVTINASKVTKIGTGAIIGAGAIVLEDVPPYAVVVGNPGKIKKYRYTPEQIECLLRVQWWNWSDDERDKYADCLYDPRLFFETFM